MGMPWGCHGDDVVATWWNVVGRLGGGAGLAWRHDGAWMVWGRVCGLIGGLAAADGILPIHIDPVKVGGHEQLY